jgi:hypothetical protein
MTVEQQRAASRLRQAQGQLAIWLTRQKDRDVAIVALNLTLLNLLRERDGDDADAPQAAVAATDAGREPS